MYIIIRFNFDITWFLKMKVPRFLKVPGPRPDGGRWTVKFEDESGGLEVDWLEVLFEFDVLIEVDFLLGSHGDFLRLEGSFFFFVWSFSGVLSPGEISEDFWGSVSRGMEVSWGWGWGALDSGRGSAGDETVSDSSPPDILLKNKEFQRTIDILANNCGTLKMFLFLTFKSFFSK